MQPVSYAPSGASGTHGRRTISATAAMIAIAMQQQREEGGHAGIIQARRQQQHGGVHTGVHCRQIFSSTAFILPHSSSVRLRSRPRLRATPRNLLNQRGSRYPSLRDAPHTIHAEIHNFGYLPDAYPCHACRGGWGTEEWAIGRAGP
jgi:hypothetical protein